MGGRRHSSGNEMKPSKEKASEQGVGAGRFQRRNSNKGGKRIKDQKFNSTKKSEATSAVSDSASRSSDTSDEGSGQARASSDVYYHLFKIFKREKEKESKDLSTISHHSTLLQLVKACLHVECQDHAQSGLPYCCFKDISQFPENLLQSSNKSQIIGLGIRLKEMISHQ